MIILVRIQSCKIILRRVKRIINPFIFQNNFQFLPVKVKESISHYLYDCKIYEEDRKVLEKDVERILAAYGLQHVPEINIKLMTGNSEEATRAANLELRNALASFITRTGRFTR